MLSGERCKCVKILYTLLQDECLLSNIALDTAENETFRGHLFSTLATRFCCPQCLRSHIKSRSIQQSRQREKRHDLLARFIENSARRSRWPRDPLEQTGLQRLPGCKAGVIANLNLKSVTCITKPWRTRSLAVSKSTFLRVNIYFSACVKSYQLCTRLHRSSLRNSAKFVELLVKFIEIIIMFI